MPYRPSTTPHLPNQTNVEYGPFWIADVDAVCPVLLPFCIFPKDAPFPLGRLSQLSVNQPRYYYPTKRGRLVTLRILICRR